MANFVTLQVVHNRASAEPNAASEALAFHRTGALTLGADPSGGAGVAAFLDGLEDVELVEVALVLIWPGAVAGPLILTSRIGSTVWYGAGSMSGVLLPNAAGEFCLDSQPVVAGGAALSARVSIPLFRISGVALGALATGPVTTVIAFAKFRERGAMRRVGASALGGFVGDGSTLGATLDAHAVQLRDLGARTVLGVTSAGQTVTVGNAGFTAPDPWGRVWIRPGQLGNAVEQIPVSASNNSELHYRFHPSVFLRAASGIVRSTSIRELPRAEALTEEFGALEIRQVDRAPTHSAWHVSVDGADQQIVVAHPQGSDFRTPLEVWEGVMQGALLSTGANLLPTYERDGAGDFFQSGTISSLGFVSYARFLEPLDGDVATPIYTRIPQTA